MHKDKHKSQHEHEWMATVNRLKKIIEKILKRNERARNE